MKMNTILQQDINKFVADFLLVRNIENSSFLITGATGLIGSILVKCLLALNSNIKITCPVRNVEKAKDIFEKNFLNINFVECDLTKFLGNQSLNYDYIVHCASPTSGAYMIQHPVETFMFTIDTTRCLLDYLVSHHDTKMVYISSLEYYGQVFEEKDIFETDLGYIDHSSSRSCYPLAKQAAEYLCSSYSLEYGVDVKVARLTQTFGAGISESDNRVFAQFARSIINNQDIILHTTGESSKPYCYTIDCVSAVLYILIKGSSGEAYNVANPDTYISIKNLADFLRNNFNQNIKVKIELHPEMGYAPVTKLRLNVDKLKALGWAPFFSLKQMFHNLILSLS